MTEYSADSSFYHDMFEMGIHDMDRVIAAAMKNGADYADLYFENTLYRDLGLRDGIVASGGIHIDYGVGIRALKGEKCGYSYCENTELPDMLRAAAVAGSIASCGTGTKAPVFRAASSGVYADQAYSLWKNADNRKSIALLERMEAELRRRESRIDKVIARISGSDTYIMMYNSAGELCCDYRPMGSISVSIIFSHNGVSGNRSASRSFRTGTQMLTDELADAIIKDLLKGIDASLQAGRPKGGKMPVVMGAGASGILLHEAMGHAFEADFNRKGQSVFSDRMGCRICPKGINIIDDGTWEGNRGSCNFDDEGIRGQRTCMVEDGILTSYLHDRISAAHYGVSPTGNGRREGFRYAPIPRMRLTYMESGDCSAEDIISSVSHGIYVDEFSNGQVKIGEGDFTFYVKSGYMIENGRLTRPIKDINVIGNGPRALADIEMVGNDLKIDNGTWTCGKDQSVPVGCGMPTVKVRELIAGGE